KYKINIDSNNYAIKRADDNEMVKEVYFKYIKANTKNTFVFRPTGSVGGASTIYFSSSNKKYSIIVSPIAGRIRYE
ncbi:MAG: prepilin-type cleavage/methylation domain-containing protein, partial [Anaerococcus vaginalis]|nr:prepilin-type cleavage/methylation domain-containing protein [Anaerococcus vaginalis]